MATTNTVTGSTKAPVFLSVLVAKEIRRIRKVWLLCDYSTHLHGLGLQNTNTNHTVMTCKLWMWAPWGAPGQEPSTKHQLILSYERRPVMEFRASLGGLWEQAGAEPFVLRADYQEAASRCSAPGETAPLSLGGMGRIHSPHFSH